MSTAPKSSAAVPEDLPLKRNEAYAAISGVSMQRNEAYAAVSGVSMQRNEAYSVAVSLQKDEVYGSPLPEVPLQQNEAYESVVRPATTTDTQTYPYYEIIQ